MQQFYPSVIQIGMICRYQTVFSSCLVDFRFGIHPPVTESYPINQEDKFLIVHALEYPKMLCVLLQEITDTDGSFHIQQKKVFMLDEENMIFYKEDQSGDISRKLKKGNRPISKPKSRFEDLE